MALNLDALRSLARRSSAPPLLMTRRTMLGISGIAVAGAQDLIRGYENGGEFDLRVTAERVAFLVDGVERFVLDCARYAGAPRLACEKRRDRFRVALSGARFPGTFIPADITIEGRRILRSWQMFVRLEGVGFSAETPLVAWLRGEEAATGRGNARGRICAFGCGGGIWLRGPGAVRLTPGSLAMAADAIAVARIAGRSFRADEAAIALTDGAPALLAEDAGRPTLVALRRGAHTWPALFAPGNGVWKLERTSEHPFDELVLDAAEGRDAASHAVLLRSQQDAPLRFSPGRLHHEDGTPFSIALRDVRHAIDMDGHEPASALMASIAEQHVAVGDGFALQLGPADPANANEFCLRMTGGAVDCLECRPGITAVGVQTPHAIVQTTRIPDCCTLSFTWEQLKESIFSTLSFDHRGEATCRFTSFRSAILRPRDLVALELEFIGFDLVLSKKTPRVVKRTDDSVIVVHFPPQHIAERAFYEMDDKTTQHNGNSDHETPNPPPVDRRMAGESRLAFVLPKNVTEIAYEVDALLAWDDWTPHVVEAAQKKGDAKPVKGICAPGADQTAIEAPYRVILSPTSDMKWQPLLPPSQDRDELWHAALYRPAPKPSEEEIPERPPDLRPPPPTIRAVWTPDLTDATCDHGDAPNPTKDGVPFTLPMTPDQRNQVVHLSANYELTTIENVPYVPVPIDARHLLLTALGANFDIEGHWDPIQIVSNCGLDVASWKHRIGLGRDHYVEVVQIGFACPHGHLIARIRESERKLQPRAEEPAAPSVAYLRVREYIVAMERRKSYPAFQQPYAGRGTAFREIYFETDRSPALDLVKEPPDPADECKNRGVPTHWPTINEKPFVFRFGAKNVSRGVPDVFFDLPIMFVSLRDAFNPNKFQEIKQKYFIDIARRTTTLSGQRVTFANEQKDGDSTLETDTIIFTIEKPPGAPNERDFRRAHQPMFYPQVEKASVRVPSVQHFTGSNATTDMEFPQTYLDHGFGETPATSATAAAATTPKNSGQVFLQVATPAQPPLSFPGGRSGGFATPSVDISALSRMAGPISGAVDKFADGLFEATEFFAKVDEAKLLGVIPLGQLIQPIHDIRTQLDRIPKLILEQVRGVQNEVDKAILAVAGIVAKAGEQLEAAIEPVNQKMSALRAVVVANQTAIERDVDSTRQQIRQILRNAEALGREEMERQLRPLAERVQTLQQQLDQAAPAAITILAKAGSDVETALQLPALIEDTAIQTLAEYKAKADDLERQIYDAAKQHVDRQLDPMQVQVVRNAFVIGQAVREARTQLIQQIQTAREQWTALARHPLVSAYGKLQDAVFAVSADPVNIDNIQKLLTSGVEFTDEILRATRGEPFVHLQTSLAETKQSIVKARNDLNDALQAEEQRMQAAVARTLNTVNGALLAAIPVPTVVGIASQVLGRVDQALTAANNLAAQIQQAIAEVNGVVAAFQTEVTKVRDEWTAAYERALAELTAPRDIIVRYDIEPKVQSAPKSNPVFQARAETKFVIHSEIRKKVGIRAEDLTSQPSVKVSARLDKFDLVLFPFAEFLTLKFDFVEFQSVNGGRPKIDVGIDDVVFGQALQFVKALQEVLPFGNKGDGFFIDVSSRGAVVGYRLGLPSMTVGAFNLHGLAISAGIELPFDGSAARIRFAFAERNRPFLLTMGIYGGGGFLAVTLLPDKVERLEGALEFGAHASLELGVASGTAHVLAGIYFSTDSQSSRLTGFVHAGGEFRVIGMINMSIEFYMGVTREGDNVSGEAVVTVSIDLYFDTIDVEVHCRRQFAGGGGGTTTARLNAVPDAVVAAFGSAVTCSDCVSLDPLPDDASWKNYRRAFAPPVKECA